ncbi:MAG TPA: PEP-CTERM sorting domain-containing protein [Phycisphaerae bacterium]|nr:PEP-CTERM sorting domain-containing protein [Phycisphaerae bacterium]HRY68194.1 PEP-CTERM sorting domain-containing protein [Phycisphaerae bacterium]HSA27092.1 PEP-CTERM sorting domain-containing protein [Phycisphaerae bacterium]
MGRYLSALAVVLLLGGHGAHATLFSGPGGSGVPVNQSSLIADLDFSDTFTGADSGGSNAARVYVPAVQPAAAYAVENTYGNSARNFNSFSVGPDRGEFSFAADGAGMPGLVDGSPAYPGTSGAGSDTGFTQTGGNLDYGIAYGLRTHYVVQVDFVASSDRIDITSSPSPGSIFQPNSLSVFIRGDGSGNASLYNGATDTPIQSSIPSFNTGLTNDGKWHNYAVEFDQTAQTIEIFVDEDSEGVIDLTSFAGGLYANFSNQAVGAGAGLGGGQNRAWSDNFQVGSPVPEPGTVALLALGTTGFVRSVRRRR